jgi:hypothetical protein
MQFGRKSPINHRKCESGNTRHDVKVDRAVLFGKRRAAETAAFILASPAERPIHLGPIRLVGCRWIEQCRPIHLGAIQLETLNLARLFFEQVICVCE